MDIFFFSWDEICKILTSDGRKPLISLVESRKADMQGCKDIDLPEVIYGEEPPPVITRAIDRMKGTPTSKGYYTGPIKVIHDNKDFSKVMDGDVIVIPYSDVGWTPLFSKAGAVIAESGGMLSHSAIIAREYQIPAIVSVNNCMKLPDHQIVNVNGYTGEIIIIAEKTKEA